MSVQWFPGHMAKTRRQIKSQLKYCHLAIELIDARVPISSRNPIVNELLGEKPRVVVLNKADLADPRMTARWEQLLSRGGNTAIQADSVKGVGIRKIIEAIHRAAAQRRKSPSGSIRVMIIGIPNVGKSSFINRLVGQKAAKTGRAPGLTRGSQWIRIAENIELLDTPGILWPKFEDPEVGFKLAVTGAVKEDILDRGAVVTWLLGWIREHAPEAGSRYGLSVIPPTTEETLALVGARRGLLQAGGRVDDEKAASLILKDFREGRLGRFTLDIPVV